MYVSPREIINKYNISKSTLRRWRLSGEIEFIPTKGNHFRYLESSIRQSSNDTRYKVYYCRVSSSKQKDDLERQKKAASEEFPEHKIIQDIGSGLNLKRKGFLNMVDKILEGNIKEVVVAHRDRLCRFAFDLLEWICRRSDCKLVVQSKIIKSSDQELTEDLMAIVHVFSCKFNGKRRYKSKKDSIQTNIGTDQDSSEMDGRLSSDLEYGSETSEGEQKENLTRPEKRRRNEKIN